MIFQIACCLLSFAPLSNGLVQFKNSTLYDIFDFKDTKEVTVTQCDEGCLIYASITDEGEEYMEKLAIYNTIGGFSQNLASIASIAHLVDDTSKKLSFNLGRSGTYTIRNLNAGSATPSDVAVYVVDRATAFALNYEIYDASTMARPNVVPKNIVTVMGAKQFVVKADKGAANSFTARLVGPDNAQGSNGDSCIEAYQTNKYEGLEFHVNGPLVSFVFNMKNLIAIRATYDNWNVRDLATPAGIVSSPGYHGCASVDQTQVYRQLNFGFNQAEYYLESGNMVNVVFNTTMNVANPLIFKDLTNSQKYAIGGQHDNYHVSMEKTKYASVFYDSVYPPYSFVARHSATKA